MSLCYINGDIYTQELVHIFNFHNYDDLNHAEKKLDPRRRKFDEANSVVNLLFGAANGDVTAIRRYGHCGKYIFIIKDILCEDNTILWISKLCRPTCVFVRWCLIDLV